MITPNDVGRRNQRLLQVCKDQSYGNIEFVRKIAMPRKRKSKPFQVVTAVKELARERVGRPPSEKIVVEKKKKPERHKPTLGKMLGESE